MYPITGKNILSLDDRAIVFFFFFLSQGKNDSKGTFDTKKIIASARLSVKRITENKTKQKFKNWT